MKEKILVFTKNWFGDVVFEEPFIRALKRRFPQSEIVCVTAPRCVSILEADPFVDLVIPFDDRKRDKGFVSKFKLILKLRKLKCTHAFLLHRSCSRAFIVKMAGIPFRCGYDTKKRGKYLTHPLPEPDNEIHRVDYFLDILHKTGLFVDGDNAGKYCFYFDEKDKIKSNDLLAEYGLREGSFIVLNPGGNWDKKRWPCDNFAELVDLIHKQGDFQVVISGSENDRVLSDKIVSKVEGKKPLVVCGRTNLQELGAFFSSAKCVVSADTGPVHIASGVGTSVVALFGPTDPDVTGPRGVGAIYVLKNLPEGCALPCYNEACSDVVCMSDIKAEQVLRCMMENGLLKNV